MEEGGRGREWSWRSAAAGAGAGGQGWSKSNSNGPRSWCTSRLQDKKNYEVKIGSISFSNSSIVHVLYCIVYRTAKCLDSTFGSMR
jgi:hypothetical protein